MSEQLPRDYKPTLAEQAAYDQDGARARDMQPGDEGYITDAQVEEQIARVNLELEYRQLLED